MDKGDRIDPKTGKVKRYQQWIPFKGTKAEAENKLIDLLHDQNKGTLIEPSKVTLGEWLLTWVEKFIEAAPHLRHLQGRHHQPPGPAPRGVQAAGPQAVPSGNLLP